MATMRHIPVLLDEVLDHFKDIKIKVFCDSTLGNAAHAKAILENHPEIEKFIGIDQDSEALALAKKNLEKFQGKVSFFHDNFKNVDAILENENIQSVDGFLFDLGVSSMQLDESERGFSFRLSGPLDMRMNKDQKLTAEIVVNEFPEKELEKIFKELGEEKRWKQAAFRIVSERRKKRISTTKELADILYDCCYKKGKLHPATLVFQGLRIYVNDELNSLKQALEKAIERLSPNGRIAVISFHSLEDRIVKELFKNKSKKVHSNIYRLKKDEAKLKIITKKPIKPTLKEIRNNPRSRSAVLRVAEKVANE